MVKNKLPKRRKPPKRGYKPERPVVSVRFDPIIFADLKAEADALNATITDVVHRRLRVYEEFLSKAKGNEEWSVQRDRIATALIHRQALIGHGFDPQSDRAAAWQQIERREVEADLRRLGFTRIDSPGGVLWAEPGASVPASIVKAIQEPKT
jgi:hypothetical protein